MKASAVEPTGPGPEIVAHRVGNEPDTVASVLDRCDLVEADVHLFRGRVELRHEKVLRPTERLWEKWRILPRDAPAPPTIEDLLRATSHGVPLMLDLKCFTRRAARRIRDSVPADLPITVSSRSWWILGVFANRPRTRVLRSCGSRLQIRFVRLLPGLGPARGVAAHERLLAPETAAWVRTRTDLLFSWGATSGERARELVAMGVTGLIVDDLDLDWPR